MKKLLGTWNSLGTANSFTSAVLRLITYSLLLFLAFECVTVDFKWPEQAVLGVLTIVLTLAIHAVSESELVRLALMFASMLATTRYADWRFSTVIQALLDKDHPIAWLDVFFMLVLLSAEVYAFVILYLGYIQTIRPLRRPPIPLPVSLDDCRTSMC